MDAVLYDTPHFDGGLIEGDYRVRLFLTKDPLLVDFWLTKDDDIEVGFNVSLTYEGVNWGNRNLNPEFFFNLNRPHYKWWIADAKKMITPAQFNTLMKAMSDDIRTCSQCRIRGFKL